MALHGFTGIIFPSTNLALQVPLVSLCLVLLPHYSSEWLLRTLKAVISWVGFVWEVASMCKRIFVPWLVLLSICSWITLFELGVVPMWLELRIIWGVVWVCRKRRCSLIPLWFPPPPWFQLRADWLERGKGDDRIIVTPIELCSIFLAVWG